MVYKGLNTATGEIIAIKELNFDGQHAKSRQLKEMIKEVELMRRLNHPNIVKYLGGQEISQAGGGGGGGSAVSCLCIFTEFVAGGCVESLIARCAKSTNRKSSAIPDTKSSMIAEAPKGSAPWGAACSRPPGCTLRPSSRAYPLVRLRD